MKAELIIILSVLFACKNVNNKASNEKNGDKMEVKATKEYTPEYPLAKFHYDENIIDVGKRESYFPDGVTDLKIDTANGHLIVSFDREGGIGCPLNGQIDRHVHFNDKIRRDTIFLDFFENCDGIDSPVTESVELRLYYQITDELSYKRALFIPRLIEPK